MNLVCPRTCARKQQENKINNNSHDGEEVTLLELVLSLEMLKQSETLLVRSRLLNGGLEVD